MASQPNTGTLSKQFDFKTIEPQVYEASQDDIVRTTKRNRRQETFTITLPPPNITGFLHIGHAFTSTLQDIMLRFKRQQGFITFGQPGIDHAGIATQIVVEKQLAKKGLTRQELGRDAFIEKVWEWKAESGGTILKQLRRLGMSVDWNTTRFTMDDDSNKAVRRAFVQLFRDGLIYRDERMVNWDPSLKTAVSDLEVANRIEQGNLWYIRYDVTSSQSDLPDTDDSLVIATTRPETLFGDTAIALNPLDPRAQKYVGKWAVLPLVGRKIPIIVDEAIAMDKGSGVLKVTPAHSFEDFEIGQRHDLSSINILNDDATLNDAVPEQFRGMTCQQARQATVQILEETGLLEKVEPISHSVPYNERTGCVVEPRLTKQWFVNAQELALPAIQAVESGRIRFIPDQWKNTFFEWMRNIQPWCISRQIWWGHQIPVWYAPDDTVFCAETEEEAQQQAADYFHCTVDQLPHLRRDPDVLDTWFSSGLWPFSTQYWPDLNSEQKDILKHRYPNSLMITAFDIIFFWVARMIMMGLYFMKDVPFKDVYIHPLVRDAKGQKMSKSKGNVIDPLELMDQYGTDAMRLTLASFAIPGRDIRISNALVEGSRNFITKIWNAAKFLEMNECRMPVHCDLSQVKGDLNLWILAKLKSFQKDTFDAYESYRFDYAARNVMKFLRDDFCDVYIEGLKSCLASSEEEKRESQSVAGFVFVEFLKIAHPIIPFVTEYLASIFQPQECPKLIVAPWTDLEGISETPQADLCIELTQEIRSLRGILNVPASEKLNLITKGGGISQFVQANQHWISTLARLNTILSEEMPGKENLQDSALKLVVKGAEFGLQCPSGITKADVKTVIEKKITEYQKDCALLSKKIQNEAFKQASPDKWEEDCQKFHQKQSSIEKLQQSIQGL